MTNGHYICHVRRKIYKEDIIEAGQNLMFAQGFSATGIKDITDQIGIPKGSFYNHFSSKEEFGLSVLRSYMKNGLEIHKSRMQDATKSPIDRIKSFYEGNINEYVKVLDFKLGCMMGNFATEMADINESFRALLEQGFEEQEAEILKCLNEAQASGALAHDKDTALMASSIINGWHGALVRMKATANSKPLNDFKRHFLDTL